MKRQPQMTLEEHREFGKKLREVLDALPATAMYGKSSRAYHRAARVRKWIDALRCELDERVFAEHGEQHGRDGVDLIEVYYPPANPN